MSKRKKNRTPILAILLAICAILLVILVVLLINKRPAAGKEQEESMPSVTTATDSGSTAFIAPSTTATQQAATTTTQVTTTATAATTAAIANDPRGDELLQYDTTGHYVQPESAKGEWQFLLVNDWNPLPADYDNTVSLAAVGNQKVDSRILESLNAMISAGSAYGIGVQSGYRSAEHQATLYWRQVNRFRNNGYGNTEAQSKAGTIVKRPGYSEHNSGLAVDMGGSGNFRLEEDFKYTEAYKWLIAHCADYGFILRFPEGKENETGVIYEPWHYRYVGVDAAKTIMERGITLEAYLEEVGG